MTHYKFVPNHEALIALIEKGEQVYYRPVSTEEPLRGLLDWTMSKSLLLVKWSHHSFYSKFIKSNWLFYSEKLIQDEIV